MTSAGHLCVAGASRSACAAAAHAQRPDVAVDCHRNLRGPYTGTGSLLRALVPGVHAARAELTARHAIEILAAAPELEPLLGGAPDTLTSLAPPSERTRWYSRLRTRRIAHGLVDFLRECARVQPLSLGFCSVDHADRTDAEFLAIALRRLDPAQVRLIVCSREAITDPELGDAIAACCQPLAAAPAVVVEEGLARRPASHAAAAFVASDGTSDDPGEREAYLKLRPWQRAQLHDERAADLERLGEWSLRLGAIPYHAERGTAPATAGSAALVTAIDYCLGMAFYDAGLDLTRRLASLIDAPAQPSEHYRAQTRQADCLTLLGRPAEVEPIYYDLLSRSANPRRHMNLSYALAMLYTRHHDPERKDHHRARAHINTAIAIASRLEEPADRAFNMAFMNNGRALIEMHLGALATSLELVTGGIELLDRELSDGKHKLHRSVLHHNRAQVLAALGRGSEALAEFDRVIEADPYYPEYRFDRGNLLNRMGRYDDAMADYQAVTELSPPFPELYYNRADLLATTGDLEGAIGDFRYVLDLEPDYVDARVGLASLLLDTGQPQEAAAQILLGLGYAPGEARLHCTLGLAQLEIGDCAAAWQSFTTALELDPGLTEALADRAIAAHELGRNDEAIADLTAALDARPGDPDLLASLAALEVA